MSTNIPFSTSYPTIWVIHFYYIQFELPFDKFKFQTTGTHQWTKVTQIHRKQASIAESIPTTSQHVVW